MSSVSDISSVFGSFARPPIPKGPSIEIKLDNHYNSKVYSSGSPVAGEVVGVTVGDAKLNLSVPLQVIVEPTADQMMQATGLPSFDAVMALQEAADADELLRGRVMRQPDPDFQETSVLPGYGEFLVSRAVHA
ncbi:hypothetical protein BN1723_000909, partial [Verticillium longisporum]